MSPRTSGWVRSSSPRLARGRRIALLRRSAGLGITLLLVWGSLGLGVACWTATVWAQTEADAPSIFVPADRKVTQALRNAQELIGEKRYSEAVRLLGSVLESPEDYFVADRPPQPEKPPEDPNNNQIPGRRVFPGRPNVVQRVSSQSVTKSVKNEAQRIIGELPDEGREAYELQYAADAQRLLDAAARAGDLAGLSEVSRRFFHTKAGYEATELLGTCLLERGQPQAAAHCYQRLLETSVRESFEPGLSLKLAVALARSGQQNAAIEAAQQLSARGMSVNVQVNGQESPLTDRGALVAWLNAQGAATPVTEVQRDDPWLMYRGNVARNGASSGSTPLLNRRWAVPTLYDPEPRKLDLERLIAQRRSLDSEHAETQLPSSVPLAIGEQIVARTVLGLVAINMRTGKRIWFDEDPLVRQQLDKFAQETAANQPVAIPDWLDNRLWNDAIHGQLSSDGKFIFCIDSLPLNTPNPFERNIFLANGSRQTQTRSTTNRLKALSLAREGALEADSSDVKELDGMFFLGPPLPLGDRLYVIAEAKGELRLVALKLVNHVVERHKSTGKLKPLYRFEHDWSQQLVGPDRTVSEDHWRRFGGAMPSYADGMLICPTSAGAIVAVDLTTRRLAWGYQHPRLDPGARMNMAFVNGRPVTNNTSENQRWVDSCVTLAQGKVLITPVEGNDLYCLNLADGALAWKAERGDGLYLAGVHNGHVIIVGANTLRALSLADGKKVAWTTTFPENHAPSGRGFLSGDQYCLPLTSAEVLTVNLKDGKIVGHSRSRTGQMVGNLICYRGAVISQSADAIESFYQLADLQQEVTATLAKAPEDALALALRGDLRLDHGELGPAIDDLRLSLKLRPDPRTRRLLFEALLERLKGDFAKHQADVDELTGLIDQPSQRLSLLRIVATGQQQSGKLLAAFDSYLKIMAEQPTDDLERLDRQVAVRRDRWVQARMKDLREHASADDLAQIEERLRAQLDTARQAASTDMLRRFVDHFGSHPLADDAREALLARSGAVDTKLEEELLLRQLEQSSDTNRSAHAVARLARLLHDANRDGESASYVERLQGPLAKVVCLDGKTGGDLVQSWFGERRPQAITPLATWAKGKVEVERGNGSNLQQGMQSFPIDIRGPAGPFFAGWTIEHVYHPQQSLVARDRLGREQWRVNITDPTNRNGFFFQQQALNSIRTDGHLLVASLGFQLIGIDALGAPGKDGPRVLWRQELLDPSSQATGGMNWRQVNLPWGAPRVWAFDGQGRPLGATGPLSRDGICFQRLRNLICVHPLTGKTVWTRYGIPSGSELFGDDEYVFVVASSGNERTNANVDQEATVYRMLDGHELGKRKVPPLEQRLIAFGRQVLTWTTQDKPKVTLRDLWTEKVLWTREFVAGAKPWPIGDEAVAVLQKNGEFVVLDALTGTPTIEVPLREEPNLSEIAVHRSGERDFLFVNRPPKNGDGFAVHFVPQQGQGIASLNGWVYAFDRSSGKLLWERAVERRSVEHHQPPDLPVLVLASMLNSPAGGTQQVGVLCLDKRDGRVVLDERFPNQGPALELSGIPDRNEMTLKLNRGHARLTFTDKAAANDKPAENAKPPAEKTSAKAVDPADKGADAVKPAVKPAAQKALEAVKALDKAKGDKKP